MPCRVKPFQSGRVRQSRKHSVQCQICSRAVPSRIADALKTADRSLHEGILAVAVDDVSYSSELWTCRNRSVLESSFRSWAKRSEELCPCFKSNIVSIQSYSPTEVVVKYRARWIPRQLQWLDQLGHALPGVKVQYYDVLDRYDQQTQFRWRALARLFTNMVRTGILRIPESAMESSLSLQLLKDSEQVKSISERTWLISLFKSRRVKNRRIARDMLVWQEVRQPADGSTYAVWDERVMDTLGIDDVPGMGHFDIDGLEDRESVYDGALVLMTVATVLILSFGVSYALVGGFFDSEQLQILSQYAYVYE